MTKPGCYLATALPFLVARESGCNPSAGRKGELWPMKSVTSAYSLASALEERFGVRLIDRGPPRFTFTDEGALFRERAVANLREIDNAEAEASAQAKQPRGHVRVGTHLEIGRRRIARTSTLDPRAAGAEGPGGFALGRRALSCAATSASTLPTLCGKMLAQRRRYDLGEAENPPSCRAYRRPDRENSICPEY
jgi:hypothetical protein